MSTPEGKVKDQVKKLLAEFKPGLYAHWPVQNGMGEPTLDCNGAINGRSFSIECKALGKEMTPRQRQTAIKMRLAGVRVFEIDGNPLDMAEMKEWLQYWLARGYVEEGT